MNDTPPGGRKWTDDDVAVFGTLGVGSGGFGPLYSVAFLEILRLFINELETDQQFIPAGIASVFDAIANADTGGRTVTNCYINERIVGIAYSDATPKLVQLISDVKTARLYDRVIWAAPGWAAQSDSNVVPFLTRTLPQPAPGSAHTTTAYEQLHIINSSKAFILTESKFWLTENLPQCIQSDTLIRGLYCLNYTPEQDPAGRGVVLVSYTWQDDSAKQIALSQDNETRIKTLVEDVRQIDETFASWLVPLDDDYHKNTIFIDWMAEENYHGAFKLNLPKQSRLLQQIYNNFNLAGTTDDPLVYIAGDNVSFQGGWCEGAIETGLNAATAVGVSLGGTSPQSDKIRAT